jgi:LysR family transcriptional regulator, hydrogen peroxide-inducible genes activator
VCPELSRYSQASAGIQKTFEGSSLETIRHMVASGIGITVLPWLSVPAMGSAASAGGLPRADDLLAYVPFEPPAPVRRVVLAWRRSFARIAAIDALRQAILRCDLPGVARLPAEPAAGLLEPPRASATSVKRTTDHAPAR